MVRFNPYYNDFCSVDIQDEIHILIAMASYFFTPVFASKSRSFTSSLPHHAQQASSGSAPKSLDWNEWMIDRFSRVITLTTENLNVHKTQLNTSRKKWSAFQCKGTPSFW